MPASHCGKEKEVETNENSETIETEEDSENTEKMKLIVGLGNFGKEYEKDLVELDEILATF